MKFDKETLIKQKFWVLLLVTLPLSLGGLFLLATSVSGDIATTRDKIVKEQNKYKRLPDPKTPYEIMQAHFEAEREEAKKTLVHKQAYEAQQDLFTWPEEVESYFHFRDGMFAQKITVYRGKGELPADSGKDDRQMQGTVKDRGESYLLVEDKNKVEHKVFKSVRVDRAVHIEGDEKNKEARFDSIGKGDRVKIAFHRGKYYNEPLTDQEIFKYTAPREVYLNQIPPIMEQVEPMNAKGEGVVQLKGWHYNKDEILRGELPSRYGQQQKWFVCLEAGWVNVAGDISEEAWLAQEDLWIQKELFRLMRQANDSVSKFDNVDKSDTGDDAGKSRTFSNPLFKIDMKVAKENDKQMLTMHIANLQPRRQKLDFKLKVQFSKDAPPATIEIGEESLSPRTTPGAEKTVKKPVPGDGSAKGIYSVEQALNWETAAVKRVDAVNIGSLAPDEYGHSQRTFADNQVALKKIDAALLANPGDRPIAAPTGRPFRSKGKLDTGANEFTKHYLIRNRYWTPLNVPLNPISRRVPVSVVMIVDQEHVDRVLTSFNNSKLRFLTTQFLANRYTGTVRPVIEDENAPKRPAGIRFIAPPPPTEEMETNVELVIYGIVTLYERYPPPLQ